MSYGVIAAQEIARQATTFTGAAKDPRNAEALAKLEEEDFTPEELKLGEELTAQANTALSGSKGGKAAQVQATEAQEKAEKDLIDAFSGRIRKLRGKLQQNLSHHPVLNAMNDAIRATGQSQGSLVGRVEALLGFVDTPVEIPGQTPLTLRDAAPFKDKQIDDLKEKLSAFLSQAVIQDTSEGFKAKLTAQKEKIIEDLDRWLARWQSVAKADFTSDELKAFGVPVNVAKSRRRITKKKEEPKKEEPKA